MCGALGSPIRLLPTETHETHASGRTEGLGRSLNCASPYSVSRVTVDDRHFFYEADPGPGPAIR